MATLTASGPPFAGALYESSQAGFKRMLAEANAAVRIGYDLIAVERVGNQLGAIFRKQPGVKPDAERAVLVGD